MCGIIGYSGSKNAGAVIIDGLKKLEYRGYDSAGLALVEVKLCVYKCSGRVSELEKLVPTSPFSSGIGHTRWATHGRATNKNAHPHLSPDGKIAIVHNGVIENCSEIKSSLLSDGHIFTSDTDSELIAHLIQRYYDGNMLSAISRVAEQIEGAATFLAVREGDSNVYCHKRGAALIIGNGTDGSYAASDMLALSGHLSYATVLDDGETAVLSPNGIRVFRVGEEISKPTIRIITDGISLCECNMRREIAHIPTALHHTYNSFKSFFEAATGCFNTLIQSEKIYIFACGTAYHAGLYGKEMFECICNKPTEVFVASEADDVRFIDKKTFAIFISQSGETADTLTALQKCKDAGATTLAITNVPGSTLTFKADYTFLLNAGAEIAVAATKSYNCQLLALYMVACAAAGKTVSKKVIRELIIASDRLIKKSVFLADTDTKNLFFIGKGADRITALEGALKFKEITYRMTDAYPAGELKHGPIALVDDNSAVIAIATCAKDKSRLQAAVSELKARGAYVTAVSAVGDIGADRTESLPHLSDKNLYPITAIIPLQILALSSSCALGINPDKPRNLAKSVTVI